jgi:hypothetical protein
MLKSKMRKRPDAAKSILPPAILCERLRAEFGSSKPSPKVLPRSADVRRGLAGFVNSGHALLLRYEYYLPPG